MKTNEEIVAESNALGPWHHKVRLRDGVHTQSHIQRDETGSVVPQYDPDRAFEIATRSVYPEGLQGRSFLDCACNCGGYSFAAKDRRAGKVYGFDIREHWIKQARFIASNRNGDSSDMSFDVASFEDFAATDGMYDVTWFSGIFYHLPDPIATLKQVADRTRETLFLNSACTWCDESRPEQPELVFRPETTRAILSGVEGVSWLPSGPMVLRRILQWMGFAEVRTYLWVQDEAQAAPVSGGPRTGRIAVVAARDAAMLRDVIDLKAPKRPGRSATAGSSTKVPAAALATAAAQVPARVAVPATSETRPLCWEDDVSVNALDTAPFDLVPPVATWSADAFRMVQSGEGLDDIRDLPVLQMAKYDTAPLPLREDREGYADDNHEFYWLSGLRDYHLASQAVTRNGGAMERIMDIGCASGRVLRHFAFQSDVPEIWGCDINHRHIRFLATYMPAHVRPIAMPALPNYPVEDNYFDVVTAFSVFTHIDVFETAFLAEVRRMLKPGGLAYLTVSDENHWTNLQKGTTASARRLASHLTTRYPGAAEALEGPLKAENRYFRHTQTGPYRGVVFTPQEHLQSVWSRFFKIEEIIPGGHSDQTVVVVRKQ